MGDDERDLDPSSILRAIDDDRRRAQGALTPNATLLYATWGIAWTVGFLAVYAAFVPVDQPLIPFALGAVIGGAALLAAILVSAIHSARRSAGSRGPSVVQGAIYGNIFPVAFTLMGLLGWRLAAAGVPSMTLLSYWVAVPCLIVGILFAAGAAMWNDRSQLLFGCWTFIVGLGSLALTPPHNLLAGAAGGIGFLLLAVVQSLRPALTSGSITRTVDG